MRKFEFIVLSICVLLYCAGLCRYASASIEVATLPSGYIATAEYQNSKSKLPAVVVLHGFLSTRNFLTVSSLVDSLTNEGYTVLAPNLSLGVNNRQASLACEAIHTHSINDDIAEIKFWVKWLEDHGHNDIVLLGHSYGSLHGLLYAVGNNDPAVKMLIAASLVDVDHDISSEVIKSQITSARALLAKHDNSLREYQVSYCRKYVAPPEAFLSYATWSREKILKTISLAKIPVEVILGSDDKRMGKDWPKLLKNSGVTVNVIQGANHFFYNEQEFDLQESVFKILRSITPK